MQSTVPGAGGTAINKWTKPCCHGTYKQLSGGEDIKHIITKIFNYPKAISWNHKTMHWGLDPSREPGEVPLKKVYLK